MLFSSQISAHVPVPGTWPPITSLSSSQFLLMLTVGLEGTPPLESRSQPRAGAQGSLGSSASSHTPWLTFLPLGCELFRDKCTIQEPLLAQSRITPKYGDTRLPAFTEGLCAAALCHLHLLKQCLTHSSHSVNQNHHWQQQ